MPSAAKKESSVEVKDFIYATLGFQLSAYEYGQDKLNAFSAQAKSNLDDYIARGVKVEADFISKLDEFKAQDNILAKGLVQSEEQVKKVQAQIEGQVEKLQTQVDELTGKAKDLYGSDNVITKVYSKAEEQYSEKLGKVKESTSQLASKFDEFKAKDNVVAKGFVIAEERTQKVQSQLKSQIEEWNKKAKELMPFGAAAPAKPKRKTAKKAAPKKKAVAKKAAAKKAPAKKADAA